VERYHFDKVFELGLLLVFRNFGLFLEHGRAVIVAGLLVFFLLALDDVLVEFAHLVRGERVLVFAAFEVAKYVLLDANLLLLLRLQQRSLGVHQLFWLLLVVEHFLVLETNVDRIDRLVVRQVLLFRVGHC